MQISHVEFEKALEQGLTIAYMAPNGDRVAKFNSKVHPGTDLGVYSMAGGMILKSFTQKGEMFLLSLQ